MKYLATIIFICCAGIAQAQSTLTGATTNPQAGESFINHHVEIGAHPTPGSSGANVTWDFHTVVESSADTSAYVACSSTPECNYFTGSNLAVPFSDGYGYLNANANSLSYLGSYASGSYTDTDICTGCTAIQYPLTYNGTFGVNSIEHEYSVGTQYYDEYLTDNKTITCDGYGTLITPTGTFQNVLRIHTVENWVDSFIDNSGTTVNHYTENDYNWYMPGFHSSLFSIEYEGGDFTDTTVDYSTQLTTAVAEVRKEGASLELYPNPAKETLNIKFNIAEKETVSITIMDMIGRQVAIVSNDTYNKGAQRLTYNVSSLPAGSYMIRFKSDTENITRRIEVF